MLCFIFIMFFYNCIESSIYMDDNINIREKKAIIIDRKKMFKSEIIRYHIDKSLDSQIIEAVLSYLNKKTCFSFIKTLREDKTDLKFEYGPNFNSSLGKTDNKTQIITIGAKNPSKVQVFRFVLRQFGMDFEHNRYDRDNYVNVYLKHVKQQYFSFFKQKPYYLASTYGINYDFSSIMHFSKREFTENFRISLEAKDKLMDATMGSSLKPSFNDIKLLNRHYCKHKCKIKLECFHSAYIDPLNCQNCRCLPFYTGTHCEKFSPNHYPICQRNNIFMVDNRKRLLALTLYGDCHYIFVARPGKRVLFKTAESRPKWYPGIGGPEEFIEIRYKSDKSVSNKILLGGVTHTI
uniref:Metalloendopeptidase n=1 Tax=Strongyloides papillosus TaxID=174720 RepID=A0A0N5BUZ9_STREA